MADIFNSFDKIYCINLPTRKDRWQNCLFQFVKYNILNNLEKFDGIIYNNASFNKKQNAHLGCWFSHYTILKHAQAMHYNNILILEDDFELDFLLLETEFEILFLTETELELSDFLLFSFFFFQFSFDFDREWEDVT